jgi:hypothetical protein
MKAALEWWKKLISEMNSRGIPFPMIRDGKTGQASVSLSLLIVSFLVWLVSIIGKAAGALGGMDSAQCLQMFMVCSGLYFGRKMQRDPKGALSIDGKEEDHPKAE